MKSDMQIAIENKFSKKHAREWIMEELLSDTVSDELYLKAVDLIQQHLDRRSEFYMSKKLRYMSIDATAEDIALELFYAVLCIDDSRPVVSTATMLGMALHEEQLNAVKTGTELLGVCEELGLYHIKRGEIVNDEEVVTMLIPNFSLPQPLLDKIHMTMYLPPMITEPLPWTDNNTGGLYTVQESCILGHDNQHNEKQGIDVLNKLQSVKWKFTEAINMPEPKPKPKKANESNQEYTRRYQQYEDRAKHTTNVVDFMKPFHGFYFVWKFDKRGRMYSQGYDINLQGSEYKKACIEFAHEELINE